MCNNTVEGKYVRTELEKMLSTMKKASEVCGKPWCEKDARDVLEEDSTVSYGDGGGQDDENRDYGDLSEGNVLLRDLKDDMSRADKRVGDALVEGKKRKHGS